MTSRCPDLLASACALALALVPRPAGAQEEAHYRIHPEFAARMAAVRRVVLVPPSLKLYELTASNDRVFMPEWSEQASAHVTAALEGALRARGVEVGRLSTPTAEAADELREVTLLHEAVLGAIFQATYANRFPAKMARFEYDLGDLQPLLGSQGDALLIAIGSGHVSSGGRKAVQALSGIFSGVTSSGIDRIFLTLVDRSGSVLWFDWLGSTQFDLRDADSARSFVEVMTGRMPAVTR